MNDLVQAVLEQASQNAPTFKSIEVIKDIDLDIDEGNLLAVDQNPIDLKEFRSKKDDFLLNLTRDNTQLLINAIWKLPAETYEDVVITKLPATKTTIPREKPIPKSTPDTRWEQFARLKGIRKQKEGRMAWDDTHKKWMPKWGYQRTNDDTKDWIIEVPDKADPMEDQFAKRISEKKERTAKNEFQRLRNVARAQKLKRPNMGVVPTDNPEKSQLKKALAVAKRSDASMGKFSQGVKGEEKTLRGTAKKRKFEANFGVAKKQKEHALEILNKLNSGQPIVDSNKAANMQIREEDAEGSQGRPRKGFGSKSKGKKSTNKRKARGLKQNNRAHDLHRKSKQKK